MTEVQVERALKAESSRGWSEDIMIVKQGKALAPPLSEKSMANTPTDDPLARLVRWAGRGSHFWIDPIGVAFRGP